MNRINADREKTVANLKQKHQVRIVAKASRSRRKKRYKDRVLIREEKLQGLVESVDVLNRVGINSQEASALMWLHSITIPYKL
jgi:hypothetical protein